MSVSRWIVFLVLLFAVSFSVAQSNVEGVIKTAAGAPVSGAQVFLTHAGASAPAQKAVADANVTATSSRQYIEWWFLRTGLSPWRRG